MIEFRNVHAAYDDQLPVLRDVSFTIADGEFVAFGARMAQENPLPCA